MDTPPVTVRHRPSPSVSSVSARQLRQLRQARRRPSAPSHSVTSVTPVYASETQLDGRFPGINLTSLPLGLERSLTVPSPISVERITLNRVRSARSSLLTVGEDDTRRVGRRIRGRPPRSFPVRWADA